MEGRLYLVPDLSPLRLSNAKAMRYEKEVIHVGEFVQPDQGIEFSVTPANIDHWHKTIQEFLAADVNVPWPVGHTTAPEKKRANTVGSRVGLNDKGKVALFVQLEFLKPEYEEALKHSDASIFAEPSVKLGNGKEYKWPITHVAFTDYPVVAGLGPFKPLAASLKLENQTMPMKDIAKALGVADDVAEDKLEAAITEKVTELNDRIKELEEKLAEKEGQNSSGPVKEPPKEEIKVAASLVSRECTNRERDIDTLVKEGKITSAVGKDLKARYADKKHVGVALSRDEDDGFDSLLKTLGKNDPKELGEKTGMQTAIPLSRDQGDIKGGAESNLVKKAREKRERFNKQR